MPSLIIAANCSTLRGELRAELLSVAFNPTIRDQVLTASSDGAAQLWEGDSTGGSASSASWCARRATQLNTVTGSTNAPAPWSIDQGVLIVNGSIASASLTTVNAGATLAGVGGVGNLLVASGVFPVPGGPIGSTPLGMRVPSRPNDFGSRRKATTSCSSYFERYSRRAGTVDLRRAVRRVRNFRRTQSSPDARAPRFVEWLRESIPGSTHSQVGRRW